MTAFNKMNQEEFEELVASKGEEALAWYVEEYGKIVATKVYPRVKGADGKSRVDKSAEPKIEMRPKSFIAIKSEFAKKFAPELAPKAKDNATTDREAHLEALKARLAALRAAKN